MTIETIFAAIGAWILENYAKDIIERSLGPAKEKLSDKWTSVNWQKAAEDYREKVKYLYGTIRILGNPKPIQLEGIFTDVRILDKPSAFRRFNIEELQKRFAANRQFQTYAERHQGLSMVSRPESHRLFILGKPGAGKTTFVKYLALQAVAGYIPKIPIFISLKEWSDSQVDLLPFIVKQFEICDFPDGRPFIEHVLQTGQSIVLFDGLDEVNQANKQQEKVIATLKDFTNQYHTTQCLITCRIAASDYSFEHFTYVEIADFTNEQMRTFVSRWFPDKSVQDKFFAEFFSSENEGLRELGRIPLLLTLLCLTFEETLTFPQRRVEIYEEALDALLKKWDASRKIKRDEVYRHLSLGRKRQLLARIAAETFDKGEYFIRQKKLEKKIVSYMQKLPSWPVDQDVDGEAVLRSIEAQHGILIKRARQIYSFSHLSVHEYFTAKYIAENAAGGTLKALVNNHLTDARWREVFLNTASLLDDADSFLRLMKHAVDRLVADDEGLIQILKWAKRRAEEIDVPLRASVIRVFYLSLVVHKHKVRIRVTSLLNDAFQRSELAGTFHYVIEFAVRSEKIRTQERRGLITIDEAFVWFVESDRSAEKNNHPYDKLCARLALKIALANLLYVTFRYSEINDFDNRPEGKWPFWIAEYFEELMDVIHGEGFSNLEQALRELKAPSKDASPAAWKEFAADLQNTLTTYCDIGYGWNLTEDQFTCLETYYRVTRLLIDCLELAYVSDRTSFEDSLVLPPED